MAFCRRQTLFVRTKRSAQQIFNNKERNTKHRHACCTSSGQPNNIFLPTRARINYQKLLRFIHRKLLKYYHNFVYASLGQTFQLKRRNPDMNILDSLLRRIGWHDAMHLLPVARMCFSNSNQNTIPENWEANMHCWRDVAHMQAEDSDAMQSGGATTCRTIE